MHKNHDRLYWSMMDASIYRRTGNVCEVLIIANCEFPPHSQTLETHKINPTMNTSSSTSALQEEPHRPRCLCGKWATTTPSYIPATALGSLSFRSSYFSCIYIAALPRDGSIRLYTAYGGLGQHSPGYIG